MRAQICIHSLYSLNETIPFADMQISMLTLYIGLCTKKKRRKLDFFCCWPVREQRTRKLAWLLSRLDVRILLKAAF